MRIAEGEARIGDLETFLDSLASVGDEYGTTVQAFDARYVAGREHLERAVERADRAFDRGENVARDRSVEILLYAAGRRQIDQALEMGVSEGEDELPIVVVVDGGDEGGAAEAVADLFEPAETLGLGEPGRIREFFDISEVELSATDASLAELVCERVALLDVEK